MRNILIVHSITNLTIYDVLIAYIYIYDENVLLVSRNPEYTIYIRVCILVLANLVGTKYLYIMYSHT